MQQYLVFTVYLVKSTIVIIYVSCVLELQLKKITVSMYQMSENVYICTYLVPYLLCFGHIICIKRKFEICQKYISAYIKKIEL